MLDDLLEGRAPLDQIVLVVPVAVSLAIAVVLVDQDLVPRGQQTPGRAPGRLERPLSGSLVSDEIPHIRDLRRGVLRMGVVDVKAGPVLQGLVACDVFLLVGRVLLALDVETPGINERILLVVVPENLGVPVVLVGINQQDAARDRIKIAVVLDRDSILDLSAHHLGKRHLPSTRSGSPSSVPTKPRAARLRS